MKKLVYVLLIFGALKLFFSEPLSAQLLSDPKQPYERFAQTTMKFLVIDVGARPVSMGGAFTSVENDVTSLFWNPVGVAKIKGGALSLHHTQWFADMKQVAFAAAFGTVNMGTFGFTFMSMDNGSIERTVHDPTSYRGFVQDGTFTVNQWVAGVGYARQITDKFSVGGQVKYAFQDLGDIVIAKSPSDTTGSKVTNQEGAVAFDFGTLYHFGFRDLRIGMNVRNFSRPVKYDVESFNLPLTLRVSLAMDVLGLFLKSQDHSFQVLSELVDAYDGHERIHFGGEYLFKNLLALRAGYRTNTDIGSLSLGFGLLPTLFPGINLRLDYAYSDAEEVFGFIQRLSIGFTF